MQSTKEASTRTAAKASQGRAAEKAESSWKLNKRQAVRPSLPARASSPLSATKGWDAAS